MVFGGSVASDEIRTILLEILRIGLLRIRAFGSAGNAQACSIEADHLHNLPAAIESRRRDLLLYYYNVERPAFIERTTSPTDQFKLRWKRLASLIDA